VFDQVYIREIFRKSFRSGGEHISVEPFESIGKPLPNRKNIVLTSNPDYKPRGVSVAHSMDEAFMKVPVNSGHKVFIIGGASVYNLFLPWCSYVYVTKLFVSTPSDCFFPNLDELPDWELMHPGEVLESNGIHYSFDLYRFKQ